MYSPQLRGVVILAPLARQLLLCRAVAGPLRSSCSPLSRYITVPLARLTDFDLGCRDCEQKKAIKVLSLSQDKSLYQLLSSGSPSSA